MSAWRPIATAPRDGTRFLAIWGEHGIQISRWYAWEDMPERLIKAGAILKPENNNVPLNVEPTHWQPLPEPPE